MCLFGLVWHFVATAVSLRRPKVFFYVIDRRPKVFFYVIDRGEVGPGAPQTWDLRGTHTLGQGAINKNTPHITMQQTKNTRQSHASKSHSLSHSFHILKSFLIGIGKGPTISQPLVLVLLGSQSIKFCLNFWRQDLASARRFACAGFLLRFFDVGVIALDQSIILRRHMLQDY